MSKIRHSFSKTRSKINVNYSFYICFVSSECVIMSCKRSCYELKGFTENNVFANRHGDSMRNFQTWGNFLFYELKSPCTKNNETLIRRHIEGCVCAVLKLPLKNIIFDSSTWKCLIPLSPQKVRLIPYLWNCCISIPLLRSTLQLLP